ncbi:MAG: hypothetical protein AVDCRST_MAG66-3263, partial [uncultured Pseudonocardia sp.]
EPSGPGVRCRGGAVGTAIRRARVDGPADLDLRPRGATSPSGPHL